MAHALSIYLSFDRVAQRFECPHWTSASRELGEYVSTEFNQVAALTVQDEPIGLDQRGIQQLLHQPFHPTERAVQVRQANAHYFQRSVVCKLSLQQLDHAFQTTQRPFQFM